MSLATIALGVFTASLAASALLLGAGALGWRNSKRHERNTTPTAPAEGAHR